MTDITLPGQLELPTVVDHKKLSTDHYWSNKEFCGDREVPRDVKIAKLLRSYEERPTSETWARIQSLAAEILR